MAASSDDAEQDRLQRIAELAEREHRDRRSDEEQGELGAVDLRRAIERARRPWSRFDTTQVTSSMTSTTTAAPSRFWASDQFARSSALRPSRR